MKRFEDLIRDKLAGYESSLPEGSLAKFDQKLDAVPGGNSHSGRPSPYWVLLPVLAAGLALFFILGNHQTNDSINVEVDEPYLAEVYEPLVELKNEPAEVRAVKVVDSIAEYEEKKETECEVSEAAEDVVLTEPTEPTEHSEPGEVAEDAAAAETAGDNLSPFAPQKLLLKKNRSDLKIIPAAAGVVAGGGAIALAYAFADNTIHNPVKDPSQSGNINDPIGFEVPLQETHKLPLRAGLSLSIPLNSRLFLSSGIDYSWYSSSLKYSTLGVQDQNAHYLGIPVRLNFTIADTRWLDVYIGAGALTDFCISANQNGVDVKRDGVTFSFLGAAGVQFNFTDNFGLYLEPEISWAIPSEHRVLKTYRTAHPVMFTISTGLRFALPNK